MFYRPEDGHPLPHDPFKALVVPRPIGWVSTRDGQGRANLAPYSFFNGCGDAPPQVMFAQTGRKSRTELEKDTIANIRETGAFACNIVGHALAERMNVTSGTYEPDVNEFARAGLTAVACEAIEAPRAAEAPAVLECRLVRVIDDLPHWHDHQRNIMVIGEVVGVHIRDEVIREGRIDYAALAPVARLGYMDYTTVSEIWQMQRP